MKFKQTLNFDLRGIFSLLLIFVISSAFAQKSISGSVSDETGPLPGVTIVEKEQQTVPLPISMETLPSPLLMIMQRLSSPTLGFFLKR